MKIRSKAKPTPLEEKQKKGKRRTDRKKDQKGGNDDVLETKLGSGSVGIETKNKGSEMMMLL